jgi:photosystem II stability/assembly factor-like uncharacterized protein
MGLIRIGTTAGIALVEEQGAEFRVKGQTLPGQDVVVLAHDLSDQAVIFAGTYGEGLFRSLDAGAHWDRISLPAEYVRAAEFAPHNPSLLYVGTEPANLYRSNDRGNSWEDLGVRRVPGAKEWSLPYSPRSGALRSIAFHSEHPEMIYGAVEQGGLLKSMDEGAEWSITEDGLDKDVHWLSVYPGDFRIVFAATGGGLFLTLDAGASWQRLFEHYTRAVLVHPKESMFVFAGPAADVGEGGRILISRDRGLTWERTEGEMDFPLPDMVEQFVIAEHQPETVYAILSGGGLLRSQLDRVFWRRVNLPLKEVQALDVL